MGSQPSWAPKSDIRSSASQKSGVAKPMNTKSVVTLSKLEPWRTADMTPMGTATARMMSISTMFSIRVTGSRSPILVSTGLPSGRKERPKSSRASRVSQLQYWTTSGLSSPYSSVSCFFTSGERSGLSPSRKSSGPPGASEITMKETKVMPISRGTTTRSRRTRNGPI